ncbi:TNF receptor-associated factor 4-like [Anneissia japonica]|uniref:TNF receptor-associated factor 4-like n=1 Tax=Anneissia japonica TaxID=1529436 RepID=UPI0014257478|nr:TNF receptor-associated factor 4-like [Anneissia japonica]
MDFDEIPDDLYQSGSDTSSVTRSSSGHSRDAINDVADHDSAYESTLDGVKVVFENPIDEKYKCVFCQKILVFPILLEVCGHRCCSSCLPKLLRENQRCLLDDKPISRDNVFVDSAFGQEIGKLDVKCVNHVKFCTWTGILSESKEHIKKCLYVEIECPNVCGARMNKMHMEAHLKESCHKRMVTCDFCSKCIFYKDEISHYNVCSNFLVHCPNGCDVTVQYPRHKLEKHLDTDCPLQVIECTFAYLGCKFTTIRSKMHHHMRDNKDMNRHVAMIGKKVLAQGQLSDTNAVAMEEEMSLLKTCVEKVQNLEKTFGSHLVWKIDHYAERLQDAKLAIKTTIFSPPFLTGRNGYKLALSVCLNGDGKGKGHFMSVFICICRGAYDGILPYPFTHRVTFTLIDQCEDPKARCNISYSIKPNPSKENKSFLGRPQAERNHSFGTSKFVPLNVVKTRDYIRDNIIFIKVRVDHDEKMGL